jgi:phospho-N-acetylmuramoyl-pentapeptide-transferase
MIINVVKIFAPLALSFFIGLGITPLLTHYLYKYKAWKKKAGKVDLDGQATPIFNSLHAHKEVGTPRLGGIIIWVSTGLTVLLMWLASVLLPGDLTAKLNFLSRSQTWMPLAALLAGALVGLADDLLEIGGRLGGLPFRNRFLIVLGLSLVIAFWFYFKLEVNYVFVPFVGDIVIGVWFIPFFLLVTSYLFSSGVIDGLDGLAGGVMAIIFATYAAIAFFENQIDLAAYAAVVAGATLAFLWFNIPPARFYMSETGIIALTLTLAVVAFLTNSVLVLPIIALPLTATVFSNVVQLGSKRLRRGRKIFRVAPLHHHFEALGWPATKVVMRYWVISAVSAVVGMILVLISR